MSQKKVLVIGNYFHQNWGDDFFAEAFDNLFPELKFNFTDSPDHMDIKSYDAIFVGGGSFLGDKPNISKQTIFDMAGKNIFYLGVGVEDVVDPMHQFLLRGASLIATRSSNQVERLKNINKNTIYCPDLVYSLRNKIKLSETGNPKGVLILPNVYVIPQHFEPHWKHAAWNYAKSELAQFVDYLVGQEYQPEFFSMCQDRKINDDWAVGEIIAHMEHRDKKYVSSYRQAEKFENITKYFSQFGAVITQRFHGIILSEMCQIPYLTIYHHDKLNKNTNNQGSFLPYYGLSKNNLITAFNQEIKRYPTEINYDDHFIALKERVLNLI